MDSRTIRQERNLAEKQRRDKLNGYINELATLVPMVSLSSKRLDKISVLRLSAAYLRLNHANSIYKNKKKPVKKPQTLNPNSFSFFHLKELLDGIKGFIVVTTCHGKIIYVTHSVEKFLGHQNIEMIGYSLTSFLHPSDIDDVFSRIQSLYEQINKGRITSDNISFRCRLRERNQPRSEVVTYQMVNVTGHMTLVSNRTSLLAESTSKSWNTNQQNDSNGMNVLFKGFVQIIATNPMAELSLMDANLDEYVSRHTLDGILLFADHRIATILGHLPSEVSGRSAYEYILPEDHSIALFAHKLMLSNSNGKGVVVHRLRTKDGSFVFLQSAGCLQYDRATGQVDHWVCVSRLLVEDEGDKERDKFVKRFTPHIYNVSPTALYESLQIVIGPKSSNIPYSGLVEPYSNKIPKAGSLCVKIQELNSLPSPSPQPYITSPSPTNSFDLNFQNYQPQQVQSLPAFIQPAHFSQFSSQSLLSSPSPSSSTSSSTSASSILSPQVMLVSDSLPTFHLNFM